MRGNLYQLLHLFRRARVLKRRSCNFKSARAQAHQGENAAFSLFFCLPHAARVRVIARFANINCTCGVDVNETGKEAAFSFSSFVPAYSLVWHVQDERAAIMPLLLN